MFENLFSRGGLDFERHGVRRRTKRKQERWRGSERFVCSVGTTWTKRHNVVQLPEAAMNAVIRVCPLAIDYHRVASAKELLRDQSTGKTSDC